MSHQTRRDFLTITLPAAATVASGLSACGGGAGESTSPTGPSPDPVVPTPEGYKALVAIFLYGGNDPHNTFAPSEGSSYQDYAKARLDLALPRAQLLDLGSANNGVRFGAHPALSELQQLYRQGRMAVLANVGPLVAPIADGRVRSADSLLPPRLFSHNDQSDQWQKSSIASLESVGWAGRAADLLAPTLPDQQLPIGITYNGSNLLQVGRIQTGFALNSSGAVQAEFLRRSRAVRELYRQLLSTEHEHLFVREYARGQLRGQQYNDLVASALASAAAGSVTFRNDRLGDQLAAVAKLISARSGLGVKRQLFFVGLGGFDTHADQLTRHSELLRSLSQNLAAFYRATELLGVAGNVTSFTVSDFGRSLTVNGDGTDHGWGSHQLIVGGAVRGGRFYGQMPDIAPKTVRDYAGGRFAPTTAVDQYGATLLQWFGIPAADMPAVFPNLGRFAGADLGFMA